MNCLTVFDYFVGLALKGLGLMIFSILQRNCNHLVHKQTLSNLAKLVCIHSKRVYDTIKTQNYSTKRDLQNGFS